MREDAVLAKAECVASRFWARVRKGEGCWEWAAGRAGTGYGELFLNGKVRSAHRTAWQLANGPLPKGLFVLHRCDNRACVRPDHLYAGTHAENMRDMVSRGRSARGVRRPQAKLIDAQVAMIRQLHREMEIEGKHLARLYGVSAMTISGIINGTRWRHVGA